MKILGLNPKDFYLGWPVQGDFFRERFPMPSLTFPVLKQLLPKGHEMRFLDGFFEPMPMKAYLNLIRWPDVVAMNITSSFSSISYGVAIRQIKRINPKAFIIIGGHHANMYPEQWLDMGVDLIAYGEGELMFADLIREIEGKKQFDRIPGVIFRRDGEMISTPPPPRLESLDQSPMPDWDMLNLRNYPAYSLPGNKYTCPIETSRGCVFRCNFCAVPMFWNGIQRFKSPGRVISEIDQIVKRNVGELYIVDDGFGNDLSRTEELLDAFIQHPQMPRWGSFFRLDSLLSKPEIVDKLGKAKMKNVLIGFESLKNDVLSRQMGKGMRLTTEKSGYRELYDRFRKNGIMVNGLFLSNHPDGKKAEETSYLDARKVCDDPSTVTYMPYPKTHGWDDLNSRHEIKDMFFHDRKLKIFPGQGSHDIMFNILNLVDPERAVKMLASSGHYRSHYLRTYRQILMKILRVDKHKIRDFMLLRRRDLSPGQKQEKLMSLYLDNPEYEKWLDSLEDKVYF